MSDSEPFMHVAVFDDGSSPQVEPLFNRLAEHEQRIAREGDGDRLVNEPKIMVGCPVCGYALDVRAAFCPECGSADPTAPTS